MRTIGRLGNVGGRVVALLVGSMAVHGLLVACGGAGGAGAGGGIAHATVTKTAMCDAKTETARATIDGKASDLVLSVHAWIALSGADSLVVPGATAYAAPVFAGDGWVAVQCTPSVSGTVTFVQE